MNKSVCNMQVGFHTEWHDTVERHGPVDSIFHRIDDMGHMGRPQCRPYKNKSVLPGNFAYPLFVSVKLNNLSNNFREFNTKN